MIYKHVTFKILSHISIFISALLEHGYDNSGFKSGWLWCSREKN